MKALHRVSAGLTVLLSACLMTQLGVQAEVYRSVEAVIPVSCFHVAEDRDYAYEIAIEALSADAPLPKEDLLTIEENGTGSFEITISEPGTFLYKVYEKPGDDQRIHYDTTVYYVTVYVEASQEDEFSFAVAVTLADTGEKPEKVEFQNLVLGDYDGRSTTGPEETDDFSSEQQTTTNDTFGDASDDQQSTTAPESETTPVESTHETTVTETVSATEPDEPSGVIGYLGSVLTGDRTPLMLLICGAGAAVLLGIIALLLHKRGDE